MRTTYFRGVNTADERRPGTSECSLLTVAGRLLQRPMALFGAVASYMRLMDFVTKFVRCAPNPHFFQRGIYYRAARPKKAAKSGHSTIQRLMGFNGVFTDGEGGSAQTLKSNRFRPRDKLQTQTNKPKTAHTKWLECMHRRRRRKRQRARRR